MIESNNNGAENMTNATTNNAPTATAYDLEVTYGDRTFRPVITVQPSGTWSIENHEDFRAAIGEDHYSDWLIQFWASLRLAKSTPSTDRVEFFVEHPDELRSPHRGR